MRRTAIAWACFLVAHHAAARTIEQGEGGQYIPPNTGLTQGYQATVANTGGNEFWAGLPNDPLTGVVVSGTFPGSIIEWISGGSRDIGKWLCETCSFSDLNDPLTQESVQAFVTSVINAQQIGPGNVNAAWRAGDKFTICNGTVCVVYEFSGQAGTGFMWRPKVPVRVFPDNQRGYKNASNTSYVDRTAHAEIVISQPDLGPVTVRFTGLVQERDPVNLTVTVKPLQVVPPAPPPPPPSGRGGGNSCVHVDSIQPQEANRVIARHH